VNILSKDVTHQFRVSTPRLEPGSPGPESDALTTRPTQPKTVEYDDIGRTPTCDCSRTSTGDSSYSSSRQHANIIDCSTTELFSHIHRVDPRAGATGFRCHVCSLRRLNSDYLASRSLALHFRRGVSRRNLLLA
jgi:hypothetical protein